jgi:hypothetical protein
MREVELWTADDNFVAVVDIFPFLDQGMPKVVLWGSRVFHIDDEPATIDSAKPWRFKECFAIYSLTASPGRPRAPSDRNVPEEICGLCGETSTAVARSSVKTCSARADNAPHAWRAKPSANCRACGKELLPENIRIADGCPCNSARGVNHGLVAANTCTCVICDPEQSGSTRYPWPALDRAALAEIETDAHADADLPRSGGLRESAPVDRSARCTVGEAISPGVPNTEDRGDGQQKGYVVLCDEERAKGFVRPVRETYRHVGTRPKHALRDLTEREAETYKDVGYIKYEEHPRNPESGPVGRYWTKAQLESGCGSTTTMGRALAETYARDPGFYSGTFCCTCGAHFPVGKDGEFVWDGTDEKVGT